MEIRVFNTCIGPNMKNFQRQLEDVVKYLFATVLLSQQNCQALEQGLPASANAPQHLLGHSRCPVNLELSGGAQSICVYHGRSVHGINSWL